MKKALAILIALMACATAFGQTCGTCSIRIEAAADVHNGAAPGDPAGFIDGSGKLDTSGMAAGSLLYFDVILEDFDFNLAGFQFQIGYPANMTMFSEDANDWINGTGAVVGAGAAIAALPIQQLPATQTGDNAPATNAENSVGQKPVGILFTDPLQRPQGSPGMPNAGGAIMRICLTLNPNNQMTCNSFEEPVQIRLVGSFNGPQDDIFANDNAERVTVSTSSIQVVFGDPSAPLRADSNNDNARDFNDTLAAARCSLFGEGDPRCTWTPGGRDFDTVFDYNCDGVVDFSDTLGMARLTLGLQNRSGKTKPAFSSIAGNGVMSFDYTGQTGAMAAGSIETYGLKLGAPYINEVAQRQGWSIVHQLNGDVIDFAVINVKADRDIAIPNVYLAFEPVKQDQPEGRAALVGAFNQKATGREFAFQPQLFIEGGVVPSVKQDLNEIHKQ